MIEDILRKIGHLSVRMRILKARIGADSDTAKLNERQILILEMLLDKESMSIQDICQCFTGVSKSTISSDVKLFRQNKWTKKRLSPEDERVHLLELTDEGVNAANQIRERRLVTYRVLGRAFEGCDDILAACSTALDRAIVEMDNQLGNIRTEG